jgi:hypothetical protein
MWIAVFALGAVLAVGAAWETFWLAPAYGEAWPMLVQGSGFMLAGAGMVTLAFVMRALDRRC